MRAVEDNRRSRIELLMNRFAIQIDGEIHRMSVNKKIVAGFKIQ